MADGGAAWAVLRTTVAEGAKAPEARGGHTAVLVEKNLLIQGGQQHKNAGVFEYFSLNPTVLDTETHTWFQPRVALGKGPTNRAYHTTTRVGSDLFIFGGSTAKKAGESGLLGDLVIFDLVRMAWETRDVRGKKPRSRFMHSAELSEGRLFIYGGSDSNKTLNDVNVLDVGTMLWSQPQCSGTIPPGLQAHSCTLVGDRLFMVSAAAPTPPCCAFSSASRRSPSRAQRAPPRERERERERDSCAARLLLTAPPPHHTHACPRLPSPPSRSVA
jgi:hypothetical protein